MLISIIIPVYNVERYLAECLDSVFMQDLTDCEIIAVNDGATDNSRKILGEYQMNYPDLIIVDQENRGLSGARNAGMNIATGEYIYFLDSDDKMTENSIKNISSFLNNKSVEVLGFNAIVNNEKYFNISNISDDTTSGLQYMSNFYTHNQAYPMFNVWLYVYNCDFLKTNKIQFLEGYYHEDIHFTMLCLYYTQSIQFYDIPIIDYRIYRDGSISSIVKPKNLKDRSDICRYLDKFYTERQFNNIYFYNTLFHQYLFNLNLAVNNNLLSLKPLIFNSKDKQIMKKGIMNEYEFKLWWLLNFNIGLMYRYMKNLQPQIQRRIINITGHLLFRILYFKW